MCRGRLTFSLNCLGGWWAVICLLFDCLLLPTCVSEYRINESMLLLVGRVYSLSSVSKKCDFECKAGRKENMKGKEQKQKPNRARQGLFFPLTFYVDGFLSEAIQHLALVRRLKVE